MDPNSDEQSNERVVVNAVAKVTHDLCAIVDQDFEDLLQNIAIRFTQRLTPSRASRSVNLMAQMLAT